jgi:alpha-amylase/alpha-mannosidase (GH57 family)
VRRIAISVVAVFLIPQWLSLVYAEVSHDGDLSDWGPETLMDTDSNAVSLHLDWNSTHLSLAWNGTDWQSLSDGADLFIYLNTSEDGGALSKDWGFSHTLPFLGDHAFILEDSSYFRLMSWNGTSWAEGEQNGIEAWIGWEENKVSEFSIPLLSIGSPTSIELLAWAQWQDAGHVWTSFPQQNPATANGAEIFTHFYALDLNGSDPSSSPVIEDLREPTKVDDALNLAIVFHQHQPYYKNKLTGMVEMPWVRVHAMTEYVDSPGILSSTDTKVTYNLVPSFIEQLLDYSENGVLDVHTDIARRSWNSGGYPNATELELHTMQFQSFWNSGWIYNVTQDDPRVGWVYESSQRYSEIYGLTKHNLKPATIMDDTLLPAQDFLDLQVLWYLYQFSPSYVQGTYNASHRDQGIIELFQQNGQYSLQDLNYVLDAQEAHMSNILPMYSELAASGQVELTTTPYYHPIMPLLMMDGWTFEDGIRVNKDSWPEDVTTHLENGMDLFEQELGFRPVGMWPSEEAVSPAMVQPVSDVGIQWMVSDEEILSSSKDMNGDFVDVEEAENLAIPWQTGNVSVIFRDRVISDRVAFQYGSMTPEAAVSDFLSYCDDIRQQLLYAGKDPSEHLLTVAMDGENWMFMSDFQHHDNGRPFTEEWFSRLSTHPTVVTTTPAEFLAEERELPEISTIGTGSWIDGTLSTWAGEAEESLAWQRVIEARQSLVSFETENPSHPGLADAWESLYIAEGSDWYWWYGLDQDSGYDETWDVLFKVHLSNIYRSINLELPPYLQDLWTNPAIPDSPYGGVMEPMIDGIALPGEWDDAARYDASGVDGGALDISSFHVGYDSTNLHLRVDLSNASPAEMEVWDSADVDLSIYLMQANAINFNEVETNFRTYYGNDILGFPSKYMVSFDFSELRDDGRAKWNLFKAKGKVADAEKWVWSSTSALGACAAKDVYEFSIPWSEVGLAPRYTTRLKVVTSFADSQSYGDGVDMEVAPPAPAEVVLPDLEEWITLLDIDDATGDDDRGGALVEPLATDFAAEGSLWDIEHLKVSQSSWNARFELKVDDITNIWGMSNGFSHQIVQIYVDRGNTSYGMIEMLEGANALIADDWAWEVAISATGEPGAVKAMMAESGETVARGIEVSADASSDIITITVNKDVIGPDVASYRYIIVLGSQDGFGPGKWRDVDAEAKTWRLGGGSDPAADDGIDYDSNIVDMITAEGVDQTAMLSDYSTAEHRFAILTGIEMPELEQQIFGAMVVSTTATSAIFSFQTTQAASGTVSCGQFSSSSEVGTSHTVTLDGLEVGSGYSCNISVEGVVPVVVGFNTDAQIDDTPPEILNIVVEVDETGQATVSWYTSEASTERVLLSKSGEEVVLEGSNVALDKNHQLSTTQPLVTGTWALIVEASDASGNQNVSQSISFVVEESDAIDEGDVESEDDSSSAGLTAMLSDTRAQVIFLIVVLVTSMAMLRSRRNDLL